MHTSQAVNIYAIHIYIGSWIIILRECEMHIQTSTEALLAIEFNRPWYSKLKWLPGTTQWHYERKWGVNAREYSRYGVFTACQRSLLLYPQGSFLGTCEFHDTPDFGRAPAFTFVGTQDVVDQSIGKRNNTWGSVIDEFIVTRLHD